MKKTTLLLAAILLLAGNVISQPSRLKSIAKGIGIGIGYSVLNGNNGMEQIRQQTQNRLNRQFRPQIAPPIINALEINTPIYPTIVHHSLNQTKLRTLESPSQKLLIPHKPMIDNKAIGLAAVRSSLLKKETKLFPLDMHPKQ